MISLVALAATSVVASRRIARERDLATRERDLAKRERDTARAVTDFMIRFIGAADPNRSSGEEPSLRSAVEDGTRRLESELTREPELRSLLLSSVARVHANLGANQRSAELLELALRDSAKVRSPRSPEHLTIQARLGFTYSLLGRYDEAEKLLRPAVEGLADADPPVAQELARARHYLATCLIVSGRFDEGAEISRTAVADYRRSGARPDIEIATLVYNLSWAEAMMEDWEAAALHARESEELFEQSGAATDFSRASLASHRSLIASETGDWDLAEASARLAVELTERAVGPKAPRTYGARSTLAYALCLQGRFAEAEALHRKVLADRRLDANDSPLGIGESLHSLARTLWWKGELDAAESVLRETLEWTRTSGLDPDRSDLMGVYGDLADVLTARGEVDAAIAHARTALTGLEKAGRAPLVPEAKIRVGTLLLGDLSTRGDGLRMIEEGRAAAAAMGKIGRGFLWRALVALGDDAVAHDDALGGRRLYEEALALESALAPGDPRRGQVAKRLADLDAAARLPARAGSG